MYSAIVFLPLLGAIIAGIIAIVGAATRHPGGEPEIAHGTVGHGEAHASHAAAHAGAHPHETHHEAHGHDHQPPAQGSRAAELITSGLLIVCAVLSWVAFFQVGFSESEAFTVSVFSFIHSGALVADWALRIDTLTVVMLVVVNTVSSLVHIYSIGYMAHDPHKPRFFAYLSFFTFAMLMLVTADNLVQMFFGWEGVGLASYLLIGFWYHRPSANAAAIKAFVVNRIGDFGFALGIFGVFYLFASVNLDTIFANAAAVAEGKDIVLTIFGQSYDGAGAITVVCLLLFMGAMGKSAQVPLHTWLPDAMEGPTPVSALIHAATMVTAGVFMVARLSPIFELSATALSVVTFVGAITAFFAATVGLVQNDIKRVVAYSTCSQLGYMFVALGVGAYPVAIFHLFTHAFFKALLFLGSGSVIHAVSDEQDMRKMGGLRTVIPITYAMMTIGTLSLIGFPLTAGYFSKDAIIEASHAAGPGVAFFAFLILVIAAAFTSFYSWRLVFLTFHGTPRAPKEVMDHAHESPQVMLVPLYILAAGAIFAGLIFAGYFIGEELAEFWRGSVVVDEHLIEEMHHTSFWIAALPTIAMALGFLVAFRFYIQKPDAPARLAEQHQVLYRFLLNKWYFDEIYDALLVRPAMALGRFLWKKGDGWLIDGFGPDGVSARVIDVTRNVVRLQTGYLYHYAFAMLLGVALLVTWMMFADDALMSWPILSTVTYLPLVGAAIIFLFIRGEGPAGRRNILNVAFGVTTLTFLISLLIWWNFDPTNPGFQFLEEADWTIGFMSYRMGVDGISMLFVILTTFLMPFCILASWKVIQSRLKEYIIAFLVLETLMIGVFTALDLIVFYVFFEAGLIPMFLIIGVWGGQRRVYAAFKFFLYTLLGSVLMLLAMMAMYWEAGTTSIPELLTHPFPELMQTWLWLAFLASFAVKMPMWPVHTWLPDAHVEAPTAGSVVLAAILLKMGGYGFLRFSLPMFPLASTDLAPLIYALSIVAIIYTSLVAMMQDDMKKLIAYSSVAHMGFVTMGIFTMTAQGVQGGIFQMLSHGIVSGALFLCVGVVYDRMHTREIDAYGGLVNRMPWYAFAFMVFTMANVGLPGTSGFVGEFLALIGAFQANTWVAVLATTGVILSACYALWLYRRVIFGRLEKASLSGMLDLSLREKVILVPLVALTILFGVYPAPIMDVTAASVDQLIANYQAALAGGPATALIETTGGSKMTAAELPALGAILPELILAVGALALLMVGVFAGERSARIVDALAILVLALSAIAVMASDQNGPIWNGAFLVDGFAKFLKVVALIGSAVAIVLAWRFARREKFESFEFPVLVVLATLGMMVMISANDLISLYLGLELSALASYVVAAIHRDDARSSEAGLKYFVLGALSSGMLLYGASLVYGFTGHTGFEPIAAALVEGRSLGLVVGLVFVLAGLAFKISAVPFHMWTPDVYEGAPTPVTAFFASAPKLAALALMVRVVIDAFAPITTDWQQIITFVSIASMALGSFAAIGQTNIKRLMAYSSIGHMGYALVGLAAGSEQGVQGVIVYAVIYMAMTLGTFAAILAMRRNGTMVEDIASLAGLARTKPGMAFLLGALLFSLAGIPPLAGFFAKYYVFLAAIQSGLYALAVLGVLASVVGAYYYVRIVKIMYFDEPEGAFEPIPAELGAVLGISGVLVLAFVLIASPLVEAAGAAAHSLF